MSEQQPPTPASPAAQRRLRALGKRIQNIAIQKPKEAFDAVMGTAKFGLMETKRADREAYVHEQRHDIHGWNGHGAFWMIETIAEYHQKNGIFGAAAEIGVHHGQYFVYLLMLLRKAERAVAIDLFEEQHLNLDQSGKGDRALFQNNLRRFAPERLSRIDVHSGDSQQIAPGEIEKLAHGPVRLFSVDGGHWRSIVVNDLYVAADALHEAGVVILDDVFNMYFPGVGEGLSAYVHEPTPEKFKGFRNSEVRLRPFAIGCNKVLLCLEPYWQVYSDLFETKLRDNIRAFAQGWNVERIPVLEM